MIPLKDEDDGSLFIAVVNKNYVPVIDLNLQDFK